MWQTRAAWAVIAIVTLHSLWYARESIAVDRGDAYADCFVLVSGKHFAEEGFSACKWLPVHQPGPLDDPPQVYTHYPPLPDWVNGFQRIAFGWDSLFQFRLLPIAFTAIGYWAWFLFCRRVFGSTAAVVSLAYLATRQMNGDLADCIHGHAYHEALRLAGFYLLVCFAHSSSTMKGSVSSSYGFLLAVLFANAYASYESILDLQIFAWGYLLWVRRIRWSWKWLGIAAAPIVAFMLQQMLNIWAVGWDHLSDIRGTLVNRMTGEISVGENETGMLGYPSFLASRFEELTGVHALVVIALVAYAFLGRRVNGEGSEKFKTLTLIGIAGVSWWLIFPSHTVIHWFTFRHILPFLAALVGMSVAVAFKTNRQPGQVGSSMGQKTRILVACLILSLVLWAFCTETFLRRSAPVTVTLTDTVLHGIRDGTDRDDIVLTNWNRVPLVRYGTDRRAYRAATVREFNQMIEEVRTRWGGARSVSIFAYREDRDHRRKPETDPVFVYLSERFESEDHGDWTLFQLEFVRRALSTAGEW